ncbi:MAG: hypothetical protein ACPKPY_06910 [Nitrososphaeraceae archaeon]
MKKIFFISRIEASQNESSPYVYVEFSDPNQSSNVPKRKPSLNPFGTKAFTFTSKEDLMKNLPNMISGSSFGTTDSPIFKLNVREYNDSNLKVGDKVTIEIKKSSNDSGI